MEPIHSHSLSSNFLGRISNISLAPSANNCLAPLFEAITNSIQAIEDKFGKDNLTEGRISVDVLRPAEDGARPIGFTVSDNGIGFHNASMESFLTSDSRYRYERGGKGVGRLLWLKVFEKASISSKYDDGGIKEINFDFVLDKENQVRNIVISDSSGDTGTTVTLAPFNEGYSVSCPSKSTTIKNKIVSHFLSYFVNMHAPKIIVNDEDSSEDLFNLFVEVVTNDKEYKFSVKTDSNEEFEFRMHSFLLPKRFSDDEKGNNAIYYGAHSRTVERHELDQALGLKQIDGDKVYFAFIESEFLNKIVNLERTHLPWPADYFDNVHREAIELTKDFLHEPIENIRKGQSDIIKQVRNEHLRFLRIAENPDEFAKSLPLFVQRREDIYVELSRASLRLYNKKKRSFTEARSKKLLDFDEKAKEFTNELQNESISSLAEYVYKRKLIIDVFEERIKFKEIDDKVHFFEEAVHEIICPLRDTTDTLNYDEHNLWIIDDKLAFYTYFASDKTLKSITGGSDPGTLEPDITFFDLGLGFDQAGSREPISIIEFKRPGLDNYTLQKNPFVQVREYVKRLRKAGVACRTDGSEVRQIDEKTPFLCFIVADIKPTLQEMMLQFGPYHRRAGHGSYYKWDEAYDIFIEVTSYNEVLLGAKSRHQAFFEKLGIDP